MVEIDTHATYFNGLEDFDPDSWARYSERTLGPKGLHLDYTPVAWGDTAVNYEDILHQGIVSAEKTLEHYGEAVIIGASIGGSHVINLSQALRERQPDASIVTVTLSGWLRIADGDEERRRALSEDELTRNQNIIQSLIKSEAIIKSGVNKAVLRQMINTYSSEDEIVPSEASTIDGARVVEFPGNHFGSIMRAFRNLPELIDRARTSGN